MGMAELATDETIPEGVAVDRGLEAALEGRKLDDDLALKRGIRSVTGATLTARATTEAVRRILALHRVVEEEDAK